MVEQRSALERSDHPGQQADDACEQQGGKGQFQGGREQGEELAPHAFAGAQRFAQVTLGQLADVVQVLDRQRLVQAQAFHGLGVHFGVDPALAHHHFHRVAGDQAYEREGQQGDAEKGRYQQAKAPGNKTQHCRGYLIRPWGDQPATVVPPVPVWGAGGRCCSTSPWWWRSCCWPEG
ncbi:hypothetical protein D3C75_852900 [compost metagenome]